MATIWLLYGYMECISEGCSKACIKDEFSNKDYQRNVPGGKCEETYVLYVRQLTEDAFKLSQLDTTCFLRDGEITGN